MFYYFLITSCQQHFFPHILFCSFLGCFCPNAKEPGTGPGHAKTGKHLEVLLLRDDPGFLLVDILCGHDWSCQLGGQPEFFNRTVSLLGGRGLHGEEYELKGLFLQLLHIGLGRLNGLVLPPWNHQHPNGPGYLSVDASHPELLQAEGPAAITLVWYLTRAFHYGPVGWGVRAPGNAPCFGLLSLVSMDLLRRMVKPRGNTPLSVLVEVGLYHFGRAMGLLWRMVSRKATF